MDGPSTKDEQQAWDLFLTWHDQQAEPVIYEPLRYSEEPWRSSAARAWMMGYELDALDFEKYALSQFVLNCALADLCTWELIESWVPEMTSLRRFSNHWIAWNHGLASGGYSEYEDLKAAELGSKVTADTRDPRTYDLEHWFLACGDDINASCIHDPAVKLATLQAAARPKAAAVIEDQDRHLEIKYNQANKAKNNKKAG